MFESVDVVLCADDAGGAQEFERFLERERRAEREGQRQESAAQGQGQGGTGEEEEGEEGLLMSSRGQQEEGERVGGMRVPSYQNGEEPEGCIWSLLRHDHDALGTGI